MSLLDRYLEINGVTRYQVAKVNGVTQSTLQRAAAHETVDSISTRILLYVAKTIAKTPGTVLDELIALQAED